MNAHIPSGYRANVLSLINALATAYIALMGLAIGRIAASSLSYAFVLVLTRALALRIEEQHIELIPVFAGWPDAPCAYIKFSRGFQSPAGQARQRGWVTYEFDGGHFHMLVDPTAVANALVDFARQIGLTLPEADTKRP